MVDCGLTNLGSCLPELFFQYLLSVLTAPLQWLLNFTRDLLSQPVDLHLFVHFWAIIVYILSLFYAFLLMYAGFIFILSGHDVHKREHAKSWLRSVIIMIILVQASFFIYSLVNDLASIMTSSTLTLIPQDFFQLRVDNFTSFSLELLFSLLYVITIFVTIILLVIRYALIAVGVILFPLSIFAYFIPPIKSYGLMVLNFLGTNMFVNFLSAIILVTFSTLINVPFFANLQILLMATAFGIINLLMCFLMLFSLVKAGAGAYTKLTGMIPK